MSNEPEAVSEADCALCRNLEPRERAAMRAKLIEVPLREHVCDQCMDAFTVNLFASFPLRRRAALAAGGRSKQ
jgi:hypothetical protein